MYDWTTFLVDVSWLGSFAAVAVMSLFESQIPELRRQEIARPPNLVFGLTTLLAAAFGSFAISEPLTHIAYAAQVFSISSLPLPIFAKIILGFLVIDLLAYVSHFLCHKVPLLWRIHQVHHAETFVTASTGLLHHPLEVVFLYGFILMGSVFLGVPLGSLMIFAAVNSLQSVFAHSNVHLPPIIMRIIGAVIVTPDVHRIHHSIDPAEGNSNFGQVLSLWDRLFRTYRPKAAREGDDFRMGLAETSEGDLKFVPLLKRPFERERPSD